MARRDDIPLSTLFGDGKPVDKGILNNENKDPVSNMVEVYVPGQTYGTVLHLLQNNRTLVSFASDLFLGKSYNYPPRLRSGPDPSFSICFLVNLYFSNPYILLFFNMGTWHWRRRACFVDYSFSMPSWSQAVKDLGIHVFRTHHFSPS